MEHALSLLECVNSHFARSPMRDAIKNPTRSVSRFPMRSVGRLVVLLREVIKKKTDETVRLTNSGGGVTPPCLTDSICEKFRTFFLLNMIP